MEVGHKNCADKELRDRMHTQRERHGTQVLARWRAWPKPARQDGTVTACRIASVIIAALCPVNLPPFVMCHAVHTLHHSCPLATPSLNSISNDLGSTQDTPTL